MNRTPFFVSLMLAALLLSSCEHPTASVPEHRVSVISDPETNKLVAIPKPCPNWHYREMMELENHYTPDFNCAEQYNLGLQVEHPGDLLAGQKPGESDANPGVLGVERYRTDKKKELINPKDISATAK